MGLFMMVFIVVPQVSKTLIRVQRVQVTHPTMTRDSCCSPLLFGRRKSPCRAISPSCMLLTSRKSPEFYQEVVIRTQVLFCAIETRPNTPRKFAPKGSLPAHLKPPPETCILPRLGGQTVRSLFDSKSTSCAVWGARPIASRVVTKCILEHPAMQAIFCSESAQHIPICVLGWVVCLGTIAVSIWYL